jgi:hypothetical protein
MEFVFYSSLHVIRSGSGRTNKYCLNVNIYRFPTHHQAEIMAVSLKPCIDKISQDVKESIQKSFEYYNLEDMTKILEDGKLSNI